MITPSIRQTYLLMTLSVFALIAYALYTQYVEGLEPCPLCMTQRFFFCLIGLFAFIGVISNKQPTILAILAILSAIGGIAAAGRQVWLQHLPAEKVPACGPSLEYMLETFPFSETLKALITGDGNCAEVVWSFLGLSMPEWSLIAFLGFFIASVWQILRR